ncbi:hypothetical protein ABZ413_01180 [Nocardia rhamnosiphila]|uniref:hypothetical protein n=1 Tax=Nocardia rhamnosiphila TaxID=426716 RepID=UPI0004C3A425|nr:hypothetical protein [Nocardia rhamnosiphila]
MRSRARPPHGQDKGLGLAVLRAYNDWHIDEWCGAYPGRMIPQVNTNALDRFGDEFRIQLAWMRPRTARLADSCARYRAAGSRPARGMKGGVDRRPDDDLARVSAAVLSAAIAGSVVDPLVTDLDDDTLRATLIQLTRRMLELPE